MNPYDNVSLVFSYIVHPFSKVHEALERETMDDKPCTLETGGTLADALGSQGAQVYNPGTFSALFFSRPGDDGVVMISNLRDGWDTKCHILSNKTKCDVYIFHISQDDICDAYNGFTLISSGRDRRVVYAMKDPKWKFFQKGDPLWFEDAGFYSKRIIRSRINKNMVTNYCHKLGLAIEKDEFWNEIHESLLFKYVSYPLPDQ